MRKTGEAALHTLRFHCPDSELDNMCQALFFRRGGRRMGYVSPDQKWETAAFLLRWVWC
jgi:hypothetical protein